jgi:hypothetical protein
MSTPSPTTMAPPTDRTQLKHDIDRLATRIEKHGREKIESLIPVIYLAHDDYEKLHLKIWLVKVKRIVETCRGLWELGMLAYQKNTADGDKDAKAVVRRANEELLEISGVLRE